MINFLRRLWFGKPKSQPVRRLWSESSEQRSLVEYLKGEGGEFGRPQSSDETREFFGRDLLTDFLLHRGSISFQSSFADYARYDVNKELLEFGFRDGSWHAVYKGVPIDIARSLAQAPSKGKWIHKHLKIGYHPDGTWVHRYEYHPLKKLEDF